MTIVEAQASDLWRKALAIPRVSVRFDDHAKEARLLGGHVSGQTMLYDPNGHLLFTGGITVSRGHEGDNPGSDAVIQEVRGAIQNIVRTPVFGCSLENPNQEPRESLPWWKR